MHQFTDLHDLDKCAHSKLRSKLKAKYVTMRMALQREIYMLKVNLTCCIACVGIYNGTNIISRSDPHLPHNLR